jgi:hypothetical protein
MGFTVGHNRLWLMISSLLMSLILKTSLGSPSFA